MPFVRFNIQADCDSQEPSRIVPAVHGEIFEFEGESDIEVKVGQINSYLVLRGRALNERESLFDAMDSIDSSVLGPRFYHLLHETPRIRMSLQQLLNGQPFRNPINEGLATSLAIVHVAYLLSLGYNVGTFLH